MNSDDMSVRDKIIFLKERGIDVLDDACIRSLLDDIDGSFFSDGCVVSVFEKINFKNLSEKLSCERARGVYVDTILNSLVGLRGCERDSVAVESTDFNYENYIKNRSREYGVDVNFNYTNRGHKNTVNDFILYFTQRLSYYKSLIEDRINCDNLIRVGSLRDFDKGEPVSVIGLVRDFYQTKSGVFIELEDRSGVIKCFISLGKVVRDLDLSDIVDNLCLDQGLGVEGKLGDDIVWIDKVIDVKKFDVKKFEKKEVSDSLSCFSDKNIVCISDLHIGGSHFSDISFLKLISFLNGETKSEKINQISQSVDYVFVSGDIIEGVGIYPGQEDDLVFLESKMQYELASRFLSKINDDVGIVLISGNHDANRISEPQPPLDYSRSKSVYDLKNTIVLSNPCRFSVYDGFETMLYHGGSFFYYANEIGVLRKIGGIDSPTNIVKYLFDKRHLAPSHNSTQYIPDAMNDPLTIDRIPDLFLCGHTHNAEAVNYLGCNIISGGCFCKISEYQRAQGIVPDVGAVFLVNVGSRNVKRMNL